MTSTPDFSANAAVNDPQAVDPQAVAEVEANISSAEQALADGQNPKPKDDDRANAAAGQVAANLGE